MDFSTRLRELLQKGGLNAAAFGKKVGLSRAQVYNYLGGKHDPPATFFQAVKQAFPWVNIEWLITGVGEMEAANRQRSGQVANGNGIVQVGGAVNGQVVGGNNNKVRGGGFLSREGDNQKEENQIYGSGRVGGVHSDREAFTLRDEPVIYKPNNPDLIEILDLLRDYGSPKILEEIKTKLLAIKKLVEGG